MAPMRSLLLVVVLLSVVPLASARSEVAVASDVAVASEVTVADGRVETPPFTVLIPNGPGLISYCVWYLPGVAGGVGYCYDWETNRFCLNEPTPADVCVQMDEVPFLDEDEFMDFFTCVTRHYLLIPDVPPHDCWSQLTVVGGGDD